MENPIYGLLDQLTKESRISDFHLRAGEPLAVRASCDIITYPEHIIEQDMLDQVFRHELGEKGYKDFAKKMMSILPSWLENKGSVPMVIEPCMAGPWCLEQLSPKSRILTSLACRLLFIRY